MPRGVARAAALTVAVAFAGRSLLGFVTSSRPLGPRARSWEAPRTALRARPSGPSLKQVVDEVQARGLAASEAWVSDVTDFLEPRFVEAAEARCAELGVACFRVGGYAGAERARLVLTNQELVDASGTEDLLKDRVVVLYIEGDLANSDPLPNVLDNIGIPLEKVGDIRVDGDAAYVALDPDSVKVATRLLRRALADVKACEVMDPEYEPQGDLQEVAVVRLDKRDKRTKR